MPYKDKEKVKEAMRRYREKQKGITQRDNGRDNAGITEGITQEGITEERITEETNKRYPVIPTAELDVEPVIPKAVSVPPEGTPLVVEKLISFGERLKKLEEIVQEHTERLAKVEEMMADLHTESARRSLTVKHTVKRQAEEVDELPFSKHRQATGRMGREID